MKIETSIKITIKLGDQIVELSKDDATKLYEALGRILEKSHTSNINFEELERKMREMENNKPYPTTPIIPPMPPYIPTYPEDRPLTPNKYDIWCESKNNL